MITGNRKDHLIDDQSIKNPPANAGDTEGASLIPGVGISSGERNVQPESSHFGDKSQSLLSFTHNSRLRQRPGSERGQGLSVPPSFGEAGTSGDSLEKTLMLGKTEGSIPA